MNPRTDLAERIQLALPDIQVYAAPDDVTVIPAIVLSPGDPYWSVGSMGGGGRPGSLVWELEVWIAVQRSLPEEALGSIEDIAERILEIVSGGGGRFSTLSSPIGAEISDVPALTATMAIAIRSLT